MILDILVFTLGFLVAGLLSLAALPAVWRRALRLSDERLSRLVPLSAEEVAAERDHLRAAHAVDLRRTEQRLERAETGRAFQMADRSRLADKVVHLDAENARAQVEIARLQAETARLERDRDGLQAESGATSIALQGALALAERRWLDLAAREDHRHRLEEQVDSSRGSVAGLETRVLGLSSRNADLERDLERARAALGRMSERADAAGAERDALRTRLDACEQEANALKAALASAKEQAATAERRAAEARDGLEAERAALRTRESRSPAAGGPAADVPDGDERERLRAAIRSLADDVLRVTGLAKTAPSDT